MSERLLWAHTIRDRAEQLFDLESMVLFGSSLSGRASLHSDLDLYVIAKSPLRVSRAQEVYSDCPYMVSWTVESPEEFTKHLLKGNPFSVSVVTTGKELLQGQTIFRNAQLFFQRQPLTLDARETKTYYHEEAREFLMNATQPFLRSLTSSYGAVAMVASALLISRTDSFTTDYLSCFADKRSLGIELTKHFPEAGGLYGEFMGLYDQIQEQGFSCTVDMLNRLVFTAEKFVTAYAPPVP